MTKTATEPRSHEATERRSHEATKGQSKIENRKCHGRRGPSWRAAALLAKQPGGCILIGGNPGSTGTSGCECRPVGVYEQTT